MDGKSYRLNKVTHKEMKLTEIPSIFISYSHKDKLWIERLKVHFKPLERDGLLALWDDSQILASDKWKPEILNAIKAASAAILLLSADFLASEFIQDEEIPRLLKSQEELGLKIFPLLLKPCRFKQTTQISQFQALNPELKPLSAMDENEQEYLWVKLTEQVEEILLKQHSIIQMTPSKLEEKVVTPLSSTGTPFSIATKIIKQLQAPDSLISECLAEALELSYMIKNDELASFCKLELSGWYEVDFESDEDRPFYRVIPVFSSAFEINLGYFGWAGKYDNVLSYMKAHPEEYVPQKLFYPHPISTVEEKENNAKDQVDHIFVREISAKKLDPENPDVPVYMYGSGNLFQKVKSGVKTELVKKLLPIQAQFQ